MGQHNDYCDICNRQAYYDGHTDWCIAIRELQDRVETLEEQLAACENGETE